MAIKNKLDKFFAGIVFVQKKLCACLLLVMIVMVSMQVAGRFMHAKFPWTEEITNYSLIWMTFIGSVGVLIKGEHLTVDLFLLRYTPVQRRIARVVIDLTVLIFTGLLFVFGTKLCMNPLIINGRTPALAISRVWIYASLPISMFFSSLYGLYSLTVGVVDLVTGGKITALSNQKKEAAE